ncbi:unnamed protein product, partial [Rotaria sp. Silwood2]
SVAASNGKGSGTTDFGAYCFISAQPSVTTNMNGSEDTTKMLFSINQNILDMKDNTHRMDEKLDRINDKIDQTAFDTELHHETLIK